MVSPETLSSLPLFRGSARGCAGLLLAAVTALMLASCGGGSSGCGGGGSGYQVDEIERPGMLMSCGGGGGSSMSAPANATDTVVMGMPMTFNGASINTVFLPFSAQANLSTLVQIGSITLSAPNAHLSGTANDYSVVVTGTGNLDLVYCSLQGATEWWWNTTSLNLAAGTYTLHVTYPIFSAPNPAVLECQIRDTGSFHYYSNVATVSGTP